MTRFALYAAALTVALGSSGAALAQSQPITVDQQQIRMRTLEQSRVSAAAIDGRQLIAALDACQGVEPQSRRDLCEKQVRKTGGTGVLPDLSYTTAVDAREDNQYDRFHP